MLKYIKAKTALAASAVCALGTGAFAAAPTFPTPLGADSMSDYLTAAITGMGAIVVTALGGYFAFLLIRKGLRWIRMAL